MAYSGRPEGFNGCYWQVLTEVGDIVRSGESMGPNRDGWSSLSDAMSRAERAALRYLRQLDNHISIHHQSAVNILGKQGINT